METKERMQHEKGFVGFFDEPYKVASEEFTGQDGVAHTKRSTTLEAGTLEQHQAKTSGVGIWDAWKKGFSSQQMALYDLLDNAIDANASNGDKGLIRVQPDRELTASRETTGISIYNSSSHPIKDMHKILELFSSEKGKRGNSRNSIGENGVGLKQGCAALSDLSICLSCERQSTPADQQQKHKFSLGIVARQLQSVSSAFFPSYCFESTTIEHLRKEMLNVFRRRAEKEVGECIKKYAGSPTRASPCDSDQKKLAAGIERIVHHFEQMKDWNDFSFVFGLMIYELTEESEDKPVEDSNKDGPPHHNVQEQRVKCVLACLSKQLPTRYLNVRDNLKILIDRKEINFHYWQARLVELTEFKLFVNKKHPMGNGKVLENFKDTVLYRLYCGFDALRVERAADKAVESNTNPHLYIYSRQAGRLIQKHPDARTKIGESSSGSLFCQGLTILLDDTDANLPLNPTKQDFGFNFQPNGKTHEENLFMCVSGAVRCYYSFFFKKVFRKQKGEITNCLKNKVLLRNVNSRIASSKTEFPSLHDCTLGEFTEYASSIKNKRIVLKQLNNITYTHGIHSLLKFSENPPGTPIVPEKGSEPEKKPIVPEKCSEPDKKRKAPTGKNNSMDKRETKRRPSASPPPAEHKKYAELQKNYGMLRKENEDLQRQLDSLQKTVKQKDSTIARQQRIISALDTSCDRVESGQRDMV